VRLGENLLAQLVQSFPWLYFHQQWLSAALMASGGAYLLSPFVQKCVSACRSPLGFIARSWSGRPNVRTQSAEIGYRYGLSCFGCCWPLMVAMCAVGMSNPLWMLALTLLMLLQKQSRHGNWLTYGTGVAMLGLAICLGSGLIDTSYAEVSMCRSK
jgi:predicted metal-binding membrane protein